MKITRRQLSQLIISEIAQIDPAKFRTNIYGPYRHGANATDVPFGLNNPYRIEKEEDITEAMLDDAVKLKDLDMDQAEELLVDSHQISPMLALEIIRVVDRLSDFTGEHASGVPDWVSSYVNYKLFDEAANDASLRYPENPAAAAYTDDMFAEMAVLYKGMYEQERKSSSTLREAMYDPMYGIKSLEEPFRSKVMSVIDDPDASEEDLKQFHQLGDAFSGYEDSRPGMPDDSLAGVERQREEFAREGAQQIEAYLPGFLDLPQEIIDAVAEFVFLSKDPTLHIELDEELLVDELGTKDYDRYHSDHRKNPKNHDARYYYIFDAHGEYKGKDPISRMDPYRDPNSQYPAHREGDSQTGFHDGFREEYHKVTTDPTHKKNANAVESAFIEMMRDLRPDHKEYVIN